jgi:hypothetical protein
MKFSSSFQSQLEKASGVFRVISKDSIDPLSPECRNRHYCRKISLEEAG